MLSCAFVFTGCARWKLWCGSKESMLLNVFLVLTGITHLVTRSGPNGFNAEAAYKMERENLDLVKHKVYDYPGFF